MLFCGYIYSILKNVSWEEGHFIVSSLTNNILHLIYYLMKISH